MNFVYTDEDGALFPSVAIEPSCLKVYKYRPTFFDIEDVVIFLTTA